MTSGPHCITSTKTQEKRAKNCWFVLGKNALDQCAIAVRIFSFEFFCLWTQDTIASLKLSWQKIRKIARERTEKKRTRTHETCFFPQARRVGKTTKTHKNAQKHLDNTQKCAKTQTKTRRNAKKLMCSPTEVRFVGIELSSRKYYKNAQKHAVTLRPNRQKFGQFFLLWLFWGGGDYEKAFCPV